MCLYYRSRRVFSCGYRFFIFSFNSSFKIEIGAMKYGIEMNGILGMDFLLQAGATIDLAELKIG